MLTRFVFFFALYLTCPFLFLYTPSVYNYLMRWELSSYTWRMEKRGERSPSHEIIIVAIDDYSTQTLGRWPWPRAYHCKLIRKLKEAGSKVIAFDIIFSESTEKKEDLALIQCIKEYGNIIVARELDPSGNGFRPILPQIASHAAGIGHTATTTDLDGMVRRIKLIHDGIPSLSLATKEMFKPGSLMQSNLNTLFLINFCGGPATFPSVSYADVLNGKVSKEKLNGKIVLVGSVRDIGDFVITPFAHGETLKNQMPGVELHANAINTLLSGEHIKMMQPNIFRPILFGTLLLFTLILAKWGCVKGGIVVVAILLIYEFIAINLMITKNLWLEMVLPLAPVLLLLFGTLLYENRIIHRFASRFLPKGTIERLISGDTGKKGKEVEASILFADIRGYTTLSEQHTPQKTLALLNEWYSQIEPVIGKEGGIICDYQGDSLMIFFSSVKGTPFPVKNHALAALKVAKAIQETICDLNKKWEAHGETKIEVGCGISSGTVTWGWLDSGKHMQLAVIGDTTNTAARLQALSKELGCSILLTESTINKLPSKIAVHFIKETVLKGKSIKTRIYGYSQLTI